MLSSISARSVPPEGNIRAEERSHAELRPPSVGAFGGLSHRQCAEDVPSQRPNTRERRGDICANAHERQETHGDL